MVMSKVSLVTAEGMQKLKEELERMVNFERPEISKQIAEARDKGDLSENAEYDAAKEAQGMLEMKISKLKEIIQNSRIIDETKLDNSKVQILSKVKIKNIKTGKIMEYQIVSESEADLKVKRISITTPIAKGLLGKKVGEIVEIIAPGGTIKYEIVEISL
jgi:transcription elongation factor GreA